MSLFTRSRQSPEPDRTSAEEGAPRDGDATGQHTAGDDGAAGSAPEEDGTPEDGTPEDGTPEDGTPGDGTPEEGAQNHAGTASAGTAAAQDQREQSGFGWARFRRRGRGSWRTEYPTVARTLTWATTILAAVLVLLALMLPNHVNRLTPGAFLRIPVEAILVSGLLLILKPKPRRVATVLAGVSVALLTVLKFLDMGFYSFLDRPFDLVLDWILFDDAHSFLKDSAGEAGAVAALVGVVLLVLLLLVSMTLAVVRLCNLMLRHHTATVRTTLVLGTVWITFLAFGLQISGVDVASSSNTTLIHNRTHQVTSGIEDEEAFAKAAAVDAFKKTPSDKLLTGLRGKDVIFAFVESYGRTALEDPTMAPKVGSLLQDGNKRLEKDGFASRTGYLRSPITGSGSWMAHATFMSGLWVANQQRYRTVTSSNRLTLTGAFGRTDAWRTVGIMPGVTKSWPEGKFYGLNHVYDSRDMGYKGPKFSWAPIPDQYSLAAFERLEHGKERKKPVMAEIVLASSHNPWSPLPRMIGWDEVGDGSVYHSIKKEGKSPRDVWQDSATVRNEYRRSIEYSMKSLISYMEKYGDDDTVMVVLGDHQPPPVITGNNASRDVPISVISRDEDVMERTDEWEWKEGLNPGREGPVWRMDKFRDRFLTAYGPESGSGETPTGKSPSAED